MADKDITNRELLEAMTEQLGVITDNMVTKQDLKDELRHFARKDDLKRFATKDDLKRFATKDDLKRFATKDDLKRFATKDDLKRFATKDDLKGDIASLEERLEDRFDKIDHRFDRLERQTRSNHTVNVAHHLETRSMIGDLYRRTDRHASSRKPAKQD